MRDYSAAKDRSTRSARTTLDYTFVQAFPLSMTAIPVSYDNSTVLKCNVSFNFIRYVQKRRKSLFSIDSSIDFTRDFVVNREPELTS